MKKVGIKPIKRIKLQRELRLSVIVVIGILIGNLDLFGEHFKKWKRNEENGWVR